MLYRKIKVEFIYAKDRLYRVMFVRKDIKLHELGCVIINSFGGTFEHSFYYFNRSKSNPKQYLPMVFFTDDIIGDEYMDDVTLSDELNNIIFEYDTGECWDFRVKIYKNDYEKDDERLAIIKEAVGQGIWEDNIESLYMYLDGETSGDDCGIEDGYPSLPWNFSDTSFKDFDQELDLAKLQEDLDDVHLDILNYIEDQLDYYKGTTDFMDIEEKEDAIKTLEKELKDYEKIVYNHQE